jgi:ATPase family associated with various cellular activities (AAA)
VTVAGYTSKSVADVLARLQALLPAKVSTSDAVSITFLGAEFETSRSLVVPTWDDIKKNYPASVEEKLAAFIDRGSKQSGRLLLWHGLPGTGKTYALRALAREWRGWCDVQYILDPERFFGAGTDYMMGSLLSASGTDADGQPRWRLLVAEDTGELLAKDAKTQAGQGLSRLLNMVDGLIGQGLQTMVLITTNEKLEGMHEAVTRPGRTGSLIEFLPFTPDEANEWLSRNGKATIQDRKPRTLAELFAGARPQKTSIGFVPDGLRKTA